jgi:uncharacterized SAM-binding protein YcdF (DUF218 family)
MLYVGKVLSFLLLPPGLCLLVLLIGLLLSAIGLRSEKTRGKGLFFVTLGILLLFAFGVSPVADLLIKPLENAYPALAQPETIKKGDYEDCLAVVVLGGGNVEASPDEGGKSSPSPHTMKRLAYAARLAKALDLPIVYAGGAVYAHSGGEAEAPAAERYLRAMGIPADRIILDDKSKSTWENARNVAAIVAGIPGAERSRRLIVVTSAYHMRRAAMSFKKQNVVVAAAPTDYLAYRVPSTWEMWFPDTGALEKSFLATHEYVGLVAYAFKPTVKQAKAPKASAAAPSKK